MNLAVISSIVSLGKGGAFITTTLQDVVKKHLEDFDELSETQILDIVTDTMFAVWSNKESRLLLEIYLTQLHGLVLFGLGGELNECMNKARADVRELLGCSNLLRLAAVVREHRDELFDIWKSLVNSISQGDEPLFADIGGALDKSFELLQAA
jgi:hypothetical protein